MLRAQRGAATAIATHRPHVPHWAAIADAANPKELASAWLRPLAIRVAGLALGLVWMLLGTALSISIYTARVVWAHGHSLAELSRRIGVVAFLAAAPAGHRRSKRRTRSAAWLYLVALVGSIVLGWVIGRR